MKAVKVVNFTEIIQIVANFIILICDKCNNNKKAKTKSFKKRFVILMAQRYVLKFSEVGMTLNYKRLINIFLKKQD